MSIKIIYSVALVWVLSTANALGGILVEVGDASISEGGTGYVDVLISSDSSSALGDWYFKAEITSTSAGLTFADPQTSIDGESNYVFFGASAFYDSSAVSPFTELNAGDSHASSSVTLSSSKKLLSRLFLTHTDPGSSVGNTFNIALGTVDSTDSGFSSHQDPTIGSYYASSDVTLTAGTVTIVAAAVPEPTSISAFILVGATLGFRRRKRSR